MCIEKVNININLNILNIKSNTYLNLLLIIKFIIKTFNVLLKLINKPGLRLLIAEGLFL